MRHETLPHGGRAAAQRFARGLPRRAARGFSLIEMLTTMSVLGVMLAVASPGLASLTSANTLSATQNEFAAAVTLARTEALKRGLPVGVAASAPIAGAEFNGGWVVFVDANGNGRYDDGELVIRQRAALTPDVRIGTAGGATAIAFSSRGFLSPQTLIDVTICRSVSSQNAKGYRVRIEPVGLADVADITSCT